MPGVRGTLALLDIAYLATLPHLHIGSSLARAFVEGVWRVGSGYGSQRRRSPWDLFERMESRTSMKTKSLREKVASLTCLCREVVVFSATDHGADPLYMKRLD